MTLALDLSPRDRVLVFAPHPDDETLASGDLIQTVVDLGARARVIFATDGDNNPWPQRWLERRWSIAPADRARWGARRRREAVAALAVLGLGDDDSHRFLGWPDQGLTDVLMRDDAAVALLAEEIAAFAPTRVVMPVLGDRHPDHSALRVLVELAIVRSGLAPQRLGFIVHGAQPDAAERAVVVPTPSKRRKLAAMEAHASQVALSRGRLMRIAAANERFEIAESGALPGIDAAVGVQLAYPAGWSTRRRHDVLLMATTARETFRFCAPLPRSAQPGVPFELADAAGRVLRAAWGAAGLRVELPALAEPFVAVYAKLDRARPRLIVFDRDRWIAVHEVPARRRSGEGSAVTAA